VSTTTRSSYTQPALIGGLVLGVLSALPLISAGNLCCCLWLVTGGAVAAYVLQQNQSTPIAPADGGIAGLLAGIVGAFVYLILSIPFALLVAPLERRVFEQLETMGSLPPGLRAYASSPAAVGLSMIVSFGFILVLGAIFSTLGGVLGAVIFVKKPPPGIIDITPTN
jgi:uncharacterized membrane protein YeiH